MYNAVLFSLATVARNGEVLGLKWKDIDFMRKTVTFRDTKNRETRTIPLGNILLPNFQDPVSKRVAVSKYVFPSKDVTKQTDIRNALEYTLKKANLDNVCFHSVRHTVASHLGMTCASTLEIAAILDHKTLTMVKQYSHLSVASTSQALKK